MHYLYDADRLNSKRISSSPHVSIPLLKFGSFFRQANTSLPLKCKSTGNLLELGAKEAVDLLCSRQITAVQYASALLDQAENIKCLNTYAELDRDKVTYQKLQASSLFCS